MSKAGRKRKNLPRTPSGQISRSADSKAIAENVRFEEGPEMMARIDNQAATIKALVEALERIDDLTGHNMAMSARDEQCVNREARAAIAAAKDTT